VWLTPTIKKKVGKKGGFSVLAKKKVERGPFKKVNLVQKKSGKKGRGKGE